MGEEFEHGGHAFRSLILFLPVIALALQLVELATAAGAPLRATFVYRFVLRYAAELFAERREQLTEALKTAR